MLKQAIKGKKITVVPVLGNHDTWIETIESFSSPNQNREINHFKSQWAEWLTSEALQKFEEFGYYSMPINLLSGKKVPPGSRVIVLNTNVCASINWFLYGQRSDPGGQIAWLEETLLEIEAEGGLAILLGHYTPN
jgi:hypothetical protein